jgi:hypothetical protein
MRGQEENERGMVGREGEVRLKKGSGRREEERKEMF